MPLAVKDLGSCDLYPQQLVHNPNGRFVTVCGDGEYIIYTALAWRNKSFGTALEFVWGADSSVFATRFALPLLHPYVIRADLPSIVHFKAIPFSAAVYPCASAQACMLACRDLSHLLNQGLRVQMSTHRLPLALPPRPPLVPTALCPPSYTLW